MTNVFIEAKQLLKEGKNIVLARVVALKGSAPRAAGTKCIILEKGRIIGTIGGGLMEHLVIQKAKEVFETKKMVMLHLALTGEDVLKSNMICGGNVDIHLEPIFADNHGAMSVFKAINRLIREGRKGVLVTLLADGVDSADPLCRAVMDEDGVWTGPAFDLTLADIKPYLDEKQAVLMEEKSGTTGLFIEPIGPEDVLYLFGAGHISTFLAHLAKMIGFKVVVIDDREAFANKERFPDADEIRVVPFSQAFQNIKATSASYMAIVTRGHLHDMDVLREALSARPRYIGMIGSRRKRDQIYAALMKEGFTKKQLASVCCPIGKDVGGQTPEEIAVSIAAELIEFRNNPPRA